VGMGVGLAGPAGQCALAKMLKLGPATCLHHPIIDLVYGPVETDFGACLVSM